MPTPRETPWAWQCHICNKWNAVNRNRCWKCQSPKGARPEAPRAEPAQAGGRRPRGRERGQGGERRRS